MATAEELLALASTSDAPVFGNLAGVSFLEERPLGSETNLGAEGTFFASVLLLTADISQ